MNAFLDSKISKIEDKQKNDIKKEKEKNGNNMNAFLDSKISNN
jgi:hypothetical protein